jgi:hypothetical protein
MPEPEPEERDQATSRDDERNGGNRTERPYCTHDAPLSGGEPGRGGGDPGSEVRPTARARRGRVCASREPPAEMTRDFLVRRQLALQSGVPVDDVRRTAWRALWRAAGWLPIQRVAGEPRLPSTCRSLPRKWVTAVVRQESNRFLHRRTVRARLGSYAARHVPAPANPCSLPCARCRAACGSG